MILRANGPFAKKKYGWTEAIWYEETKVPQERIRPFTGMGPIVWRFDKRTPRIDRLGGGPYNVPFDVRNQS